VCVCVLSFKKVDLRFQATNHDNVKMNCD